MGLLLDMFFDDSSSDDDDDFEMVAILLTAIAMDQRPKRGGSAPRRKAVRRKLFDDYFSDDGSEAMACASSSTMAPSAKAAPVSTNLAVAPQSTAFPRRLACPTTTARKTPQRLRPAATADSRLARRPRTRGPVAYTGGEDGVPVMDLSAGEAPMALARRQKRKTRMQAKLKEVHADKNSAEEEARTEDRLDPSGPATRREGKPNPKYLGPEWVR